MDQMEGIDAKFLYSETRHAPLHTMKIVVADAPRMGRSDPYQEVINELVPGLSRLKPFRRRVVPIPLGLGHPVWVDDPCFDPLNHITRGVAPDPGGPHELAKIVATIAARVLPKDRPLWELVVVEGLREGRIALVLKVHHAVCDGTGAVQILSDLMSGPHTVEQTPAAPETIPGFPELLSFAFRDHFSHLRSLPGLVSRSVRGAWRSEVCRRRLAPKPPLPFHAPRTPLNVPLSEARTFAHTTLPLGELKAIQHRYMVTLNDVYLAMCAAALRRLLTKYHSLPRRSLVAEVPMSTDMEAHRLSGNRIDSLYVSLGTDLADPLERLRHIHESAQGAKEVRRLLGTDLLRLRATVTPPHLYRAALHLWTHSRLARRLGPPFNLIASNVVGPSRPLTLGPFRVRTIHSVGPIIEGTGLNVTAWSYMGSFNISVLGSPAGLPDPWQLIDDVHASLVDLTLR